MLLLGAFCCLPLFDNRDVFGHDDNPLELLDAGRNNVGVRDDEAAPAALERERLDKSGREVRGT